MEGADALEEMAATHTWPDHITRCPFCTRVTGCGAVSPEAGVVEATVRAEGAEEEPRVPWR